MYLFCWRSGSKYSDTDIKIILRIIINPLNKQACPIAIFGKFCQKYGCYFSHIKSNLDYFTLALHNLPPGDKIYGVSGDLTRYAHFGYDIKLILWGWLQSYLNSFKRGGGDYGSWRIRYVLLSKYKVRYPVVLENTKTAIKPMEQIFAITHQNLGCVWCCC